MRNRVSQELLRSVLILGAARLRQGYVGQAGTACPPKLQRRGKKAATKKGGSRKFLEQARSSVGERYLDTVEVGSSILPVPTIDHSIMMNYLSI